APARTCSACPGGRFLWSSRNLLLWRLPHADEPPHDEGQENPLERHRRPAPTQLDVAARPCCLVVRECPGSSSRPGRFRPAERRARQGRQEAGLPPFGVAAVPGGFLRTIPKAAPVRLRHLVYPERMLYAQDRGTDI